MREEDLIPNFLDCIAEFDYMRGKSLQAQLEDDLAACESEEDKMETQSIFLNETLFDALNEFAPPYFYFGSHPGDGADYGFWLSEESLEDFDGLRVSDLSEVPADYSGEVLHVNDHGNTSLYTANSGNLTAIWELV